MNLNDKLKQSGIKLSAVWRALGFAIVNDSNPSRVLAVCPHHDSQNNRKGGNCHLNDVEGVGNCFSCGNGFNSVSLVKEELGLHGRQLVRWFEENFNVTLTDGETALTVDDARRSFCYRCTQTVNDAAMDYIKSRGINDESVKHFGIGYCPEGNAAWNIINAMQSEGYSRELLLQAGVLTLSKKGKVYCPWQNRITFMVGQNIYGRSIEKGTFLPHRYSESGNMIFNQASLKKGVKVVFLVEAAIDAIIVRQYARALNKEWTVIATCGTNGIKPEVLIGAIKDVTPDEVVIIPDCDPWTATTGKRHAVGQRSGLKKAKFLVEAGIHVRIMVLDEGTDPADMGKLKVPVEEFFKRFQKAPNPCRYEIFMERHYWEISKIGASAKEGFLSAVKGILSANQIPLKEDIIEYLSQLTMTSRDEIRNFFDNSFSQSEVLKYFRRCRSAGMQDEAILKHIQELLAKK